MKRRSVLLAAAMVGSAGLADWATPRRLLAAEMPLPALEQLLPMRFAHWQGEDASRHQLVSADVRAVLQALYQQTLARVYRHPRLGTVMMAVAYGGDQSDATRVHRPEVCYPAQGFQIDGIHQARLEMGREPNRLTLPVRRLRAQLGTRHEPITYWITVGRRVASQSAEQKLIQLHYALEGLIPDGLLMRISSVDRDDAQAYWVHLRFVDALWQAVDPAWRNRLFGMSAQ